MIEETITKIEARLATVDTLDPERRRELSALLATLKSEVVELAKTEAGRAESITRFAEISALEATREGRDAKLHRISMDGLSASVEGFEASHPRLVKIVNALCMALSDLGI